MSIVKTVSLLLTAVVSISSGAAMAADYKLNPFTLAYDGAIKGDIKKSPSMGQAYEMGKNA